MKETIIRIRKFNNRYDHKFESQKIIIRQIIPIPFYRHYKTTHQIIRKIQIFFTQLKFKRPP